MSRDSLVSGARVVALSALFLIPFAPLVVSSSFFFPFITGKAFFLRALIEIAFFAWVLLAFLDKAYRPRISAIGVAVCAFVGWMFVADALAPNAHKAFWSNFERMEGWVLLIHLLGFFFASSAVLRVTNKWRAWFYTNLGVSVLVIGYALLQMAGSLAIHQGSTRVDASFGNSAYLAVYLLFTTFVALWLATTEARKSLSRGLIGLAAVSGVLVFFTHTRGAVLGLIGALFLGALLTALSSKELRRWAFGALVVLVVLVGGVYLARDSAFVEGSPTLRRVTSISLADGTVRFTLWGIALEGVKERPLVGWGQEGFNYVFNKYYDPSLYQQEQWFDRAHNTFIDWLSAGGVPALVLYLALFASAITLLSRSPGLSRGERIALTGVLAAYACHNLFVFDNLYSYIYFFGILALIDSQTARPITVFERTPEVSRESAVAYVLPILLVVGALTLYFVTISGMQAASKLIRALSVRPDTVETSIEIFESFAEHPPFAIQEIREQLITFAVSAIRSPALSPEIKQRLGSLAVNEMRRQVDAYPQDARLRVQLAYLYRSAGAYESALDELQKALALSPKKIGFLLEIGATQWDLGDVSRARATFDHAYALGKQFNTLAVYAAAGAIADGDSSEGKRLLREAFGTEMVDSDVLVAAYYRVHAWTDLIALLEQRVAKEGARADAYFALAAAKYGAGDVRGARAALEEVKQKFPEAGATADGALRDIAAP